jgi:hypothetical protein
MKKRLLALLWLVCTGLSQASLYAQVCPSMMIECISCSDPGYNDCWQSGSYYFWVPADQIDEIICNYVPGSWCEESYGWAFCVGVNVAAFYECRGTQYAAYNLLCCN